MLPPRTDSNWILLAIRIAVCLNILSLQSGHASLEQAHSNNASSSHLFSGWAHPGGGFLVPLAVRHGAVRARRSLLRSGSLPVFGSVRDIGYFYAQLSLGSPVRRFNLIIDTGSTITYVPCTTCAQCGHHEDEAFNPKKSSTSLALTCDHAECKCGSPSCQCKDKMCYYSRAYAERSSSEGWLLQDQLQFPDGKDPACLVFGCENKETGEIFKQKADGILGMGNDGISFHGQLAKQGVIDDVFGLCFGYPTDGAMLLGDVPLPAELDVKYTPLVSTLYGRAYNAQFYTVEVQAMSIDGKALPVPQLVYASGYGAVMDSGTTFTYIPPEAFRAFVAAVSRVAEAKGLKKVPGADPQYADVCWGGAPKDMKQLTSVFPTAAMHFGGGVVLQMPPFRYLFSTGAGTYCLGVFENEQPGGTLIGGISVRDVLVVYDRRSSRIGFAATSCAGLQGAVAKAAMAAAAAAARNGGAAAPPALGPHPAPAGRGAGAAAATRPRAQGAQPGSPASAPAPHGVGRRGQAPVAGGAATPGAAPGKEVEQAGAPGGDGVLQPALGEDASGAVSVAAPTRSGMATPPQGQAAPDNATAGAEPSDETASGASPLSWQSLSSSPPGGFLVVPQHYTLYIVLAGLAVLPAVLILDAAFHEDGPTRRWAAAAQAQWQGYRATAAAGQ